MKDFIGLHFTQYQPVSPLSPGPFCSPLPKEFGRFLQYSIVSWFYPKTSQTANHQSQNGLVRWGGPRGLIASRSYVEKRPVEEQT